MAEPLNPSLRILRLKQVSTMTGLARSTLYWKIKRGEFPRGIVLGERAIGWKQSDIEAWINSRLENTAPIPVAKPL